MIQAGNGLCFALESLTQFGTVGKMRRQSFNCNNAIQASIAGAINLAHRSRTDNGEEFVKP